MNDRDYQLPWVRGIGSDACKIHDANGRLVCTMETAADSAFLVEAVNGYTEVKRKFGKVESLMRGILNGERHGRVKVVANHTLDLIARG